MMKILTQKMLGAQGLAVNGVKNMSFSGSKTVSWQRWAESIGLLFPLRLK
jgi:hypothetical protein